VRVELSTDSLMGNGRGLLVVSRLGSVRVVGVLCKERLLLRETAGIAIQLSTRGTVDSDIWLMRLVEKPVVRSYCLLDYG